MSISPFVNSNDTPSRYECRQAFQGLTLFKPIGLDGLRSPTLGEYFVSGETRWTKARWEAFVRRFSKPKNRRFRGRSADAYARRQAEKVYLRGGVLGSQEVLVWEMAQLQLVEVEP